MKSRRSRVLAGILVMSLLLAACSKTKETEKQKKTEPADYDKHSMETKESTEETTTESTEPSQRDTSVRITSTPTPTPEVIPMLTEADIQSMNNNEALIVYNDEGNVSTIVGRFFHRPVKDEDDAINAVKGVQELLGLQTGYFPFALYGSKYMGYTTYTYLQMKDDVNVSNASLKIVLDPEGYPCMLQSSLASNLDYQVTDPKITAKEAEDMVAANLPSGYRVLSDYTITTVITHLGIAQHCYEVISENPYAVKGFDMPYMVHFISYDGVYLWTNPTGYLPSDNYADFGNELYFENMEPTDYEFTVDRNGEPFTFTVPISFNSKDQKYYMCDPERKIMAADYYEFIYNGFTLQFETSDSPTSWNENHLMAYYNYTQAYDFYAEFDMESTDGFGIPILILTNYVDENKRPVDNACNKGIMVGWSCFAVSDCNTYSQSLDVCGHEYTHGVTYYSRHGNLYFNEYGAINEGYSDIMGNIMEMYMGETDDTTWLVGETSGNAMRSMSNPYIYDQPMYVGDVCYYTTSPLGEMAGYNDNGGVHLNNSLISHMCYYLYMNGMSFEDLTRFYMSSIEMHTPYADYDDFYAIYIAAARFTGHEEIIPLIDSYWEGACLKGPRETTVENTAVEGYERINIPFPSKEIGQYCVVTLYAMDNSYVRIAVQADGVASFLAPANGYPYLLAVTEYTDASMTSVVAEKWMNGDLTAWTDNPYDVGKIYFESGAVSTTPMYY